MEAGVGAEWWQRGGEQMEKGVSLGILQGEPKEVVTEEREGRSWLLGFLAKTSMIVLINPILC